MSTLGIESVLERAMSDSAFAESLFANPDQALAGFELTAEEAKTFKTMSRADFDYFVKASPEERKSFGLSMNHNQVALRILS